MARSSDASETDSKSLPKMNPKIVRSLIHQKLDEIRAGELESSHNIPESCVRKLHQDKDMYKIFEGIIAKTWMDIDIMTSNESGLNGGQLNKRRKMYMDTLRREHDFCKAQIEEYNCILHPDGKQYAGDGDSDGISSTKSHSKDYDNMEDEYTTLLEESSNRRKSIQCMKTLNIELQSSLIEAEKNDISKSLIIAPL